ncbi:MAG: sugar transferase [Clostridia bacterium]|nr:sugar transferase [Clostridia bacterium]MBP3666518.1 sugar transferase [Clostridia bacterium]
MYSCFFKRFFDVFLSFFLLVLLLPLLLIVSIIIKIDSPGPVLFKQKRVGLHKEHFTILKFRSMPVSAPKDTPTHQLQNAESILSKWQRFMRKSSIDELPQLFCILVGTMSFIGPRPALWNQYDLIEERDKYGANDVKPGLTGWAQINGRDELPIEVKARLDGEYVKRLGFGFDCKCFFGTFKSVLRSEGVVEGGTGELERKRTESAEATEPHAEAHSAEREEFLTK